MALALIAFAVFAAIGIAFAVLLYFRAVYVLDTFGATHFSTSLRV
jgi:hypothetical protein